MAESPRRLAWRPLVRAFHRDAGYLAVGLTLVYAVSGLAVNHIADWDPNFQSFRKVHAFGGPLTGDDRVIAASVMERLQLRAPTREVYRAGPSQLDILFEGGALHVNPQTGRVVQEGRKPRAVLRVVNWLHLNRGKKAWTVVADLYAVGLLLLALSGLFMLPGRRGVAGRGGLFVAAGIVIPILYVVLSGGP